MNTYNYREQLRPLLTRPDTSTREIDLACKTCLALATRNDAEPALKAHVQQEHTK